MIWGTAPSVTGARRPALHLVSEGFVEAPSYLGVDLLLLLLLQGNFKVWLVYLDTRETGKKWGARGCRGRSRGGREGRWLGERRVERIVKERVQMKGGVSWARSQGKESRHGKEN